ncbi:MAG: fatty acid desaturase [Spirochaetaceae bacterium]|nr:MAG: fatty acid desaturase [Spirochaetaceae bacterium]
MTDTHEVTHDVPTRELVDKLKPFEKPSRARAWWQLANTLVPYLGLLVLMFFSIRTGQPYWLTLLLAVPAGAFLLRLFIMFHDCCHGSFLPSQAAMRTVGSALGVLAFTPYGEWRHSHGVHHSTAGNLDRRGIGDVWTMTVQEYEEASRWTRLKYRVYRHPLAMFGIGPLALFIVFQRIVPGHAKKRQIRSVHLTNLAIVGIVSVAWLTIGLPTYLAIQLPVMAVAGAAGIWLFYVQHQFDPSYWARTDDWESLDAALHGSSYYKLPAILRWFSANIGLHHIHHLRPRIPNYNLPAALKAFPQLELSEPLTIGRSVRSVHLNLWDEARGRLVSFRQVARMAG